MHFSGQVNLLLTLRIFQIWIHWNGVRNTGRKVCYSPLPPRGQVKGDGGEGGGVAGRQVQGRSVRARATGFLMHLSDTVCICTKPLKTNILTASDIASACFKPHLKQNIP